MILELDTEIVSPSTQMWSPTVSTGLQPSIYTVTLARGPNTKKFN